MNILKKLLIILLEVLLIIVYGFFIYKITDDVDFSVESEFSESL